jgi:transcriptional regulator with XRE-family HTH domain
MALSQEELAARLGASRIRVWRIESGQASLGLDVLRASYGVQLACQL